MALVCTVRNKDEVSDAESPAEGAGVEGPKTPGLASGQPHHGTATRSDPALGVIWRELQLSSFITKVSLVGRALAWGFW